MKTSMMDLQTSTLTLSFWNMSRNGRKRSCKNKKREKVQSCGAMKGTRLSLLALTLMHFELVNAHHGEEDGEVLETGEDLLDHRLQLHEQNKTKQSH